MLYGSRAGEKIGFCVSTNPASSFTIDLYRLGYYGGTGARHIQTLGPFKGQTQPTPPVGDKRLRECAWEPAVSIEVPKDWAKPDGEGSAARVHGFD